MEGSRETTRRRRAGGSWRDVLTGVGKLVAALSAIVGLTLGVIELVKALSPDDPTPPSNESGTLITEDVVPFATLKEYRDELKTQRTPGAERLLRQRFTPAELDEQGTLFYLGVQLTGYFERNVWLVWSLYDRTGTRRVGGPTYQNRKGVELVPPSVRKKSTVPYWLPPPPKEGRYVVRFALVGDDGVIVDQVRTKSFRAFARSLISTDG